MSLLFGAATSDRVTVASQASIDNRTTFTYLFSVYPTSLTQDRRFFSKQTGASERHGGFFLSASGDLRFPVQRLTTDANAQTSTVLSANTWQCVAFTYDESDGPRIFIGSLTAAMAEASYAVRTVGTGGTSTDNGNPLYIGNMDTLVQAFPGRIAVAAQVNRRMTLGDLQKWQSRPKNDADTRLLLYLGFNGTGAQTDWSGRLNSATVTGATVAAHVPLGPLFGFDTPHRYAVASGGASTQPPRSMHQFRLRAAA